MANVGNEHESNVYETVHDFLNERVAIKTLGGYNVVKKPKICYVFNILLVAMAYFLFTYLAVMGIYTITLPTEETALKVHAFQTLSQLFVVYTLPMIKFYYEGKLNEATDLLRKGVYRYYDGFDEEYENIKKKRVKQIRLVVFAFTCLLYFSTASNILQSPLTELVFSEKQTENKTKSLIDKYLPLPIYMPFDTRTYRGYTIAFLSNAIYLFLMWTSILCLCESYMSYPLQLVAQLEILNYSLSKLYERALSKFEKESNSRERVTSNANLFEETDFQKTFYTCLKRNIQHHQAILRYSMKFQDYIEAVNTQSLLVFALIFAASIVPVIQDPIGNSSLSTTLVVQMCGYLQLFWVGQVIIDTSEATAEALYSTPWPDCDKRFNVSMGIMLAYMKKPIMLRSQFFGTNITHESYGELLSVAYKVVNLLLNTL